MLFSGYNPAMATLLQPPPKAPQRKLRLPPPQPGLENGDRLGVAEFMRRYEARPGLRNAQLIERTVYLGSPVSATYHAEPNGIIQGWLGTYSLDHPELDIFPNATLLLDGDNAVQPDVILCRPTAGGRVWLDAEGYLHGAPELICEICSSTASIDLHAKFQAYRRNGVREYLVWLVQEKRVIWHELVDGGGGAQKGKAGKPASRHFPRLPPGVKAPPQLDKAKVIKGLA